MAQQTYDYVIVGGGTAGAVLAARLSEDPGRSVCLIEGGPSDVGNEAVLQVRNWMNLLGSELDYDYPIVEQPRGNSHIRHSRARVLGGCSSHNTLISFAPLPGDLDAWAAAGCEGWNAATILPYYAKLQNTITPVAEQDRNPIATAFVAASSTALGVQEVSDFNAAPFADGVGFFSVAYDPRSGRRSSSSVAYLHPILDRPNLTLLLETWAGQILFDGARAAGVRVRQADGTIGVVGAGAEVLVCAGTIDTPRLLMVSGVGHSTALRGLGIDVVAHLTAVGENLHDHPESVIIWETRRPLPENSAMDSDAGLFVRRDTADPRPDLMFHFFQHPFSEHTERLGYPAVTHGICMTPNVPRPRSIGRMWLTSSDPAVKPALDFRYFTDPDGYDEQTIVDGLRMARDIAATEPLRPWLLREVAPGPDVTTDGDLSAYGRRVAHTVYHPLGTCRMGASDDASAVVDPTLRVRGVDGLRVVDGSVFPTMTTVNPMVTILMIAERAADLILGGS